MMFYSKNLCGILRVPFVLYSTLSPPCFMPHPSESIQSHDHPCLRSMVVRLRERELIPEASEHDAIFALLHLFRNESAVTVRNMNIENIAEMVNDQIHSNAVNASHD